MASSSSVRLLEVDSEIGRLLSSEERHAAVAELQVPTLTVERGAGEIVGQIRSAGAFGGLLVDGMVIEELQLGDQLGIRLLAPGDVIWVSSGPPPMVLSSVRCEAAAPTQLALLGDEFLIAARRWPRLISGLHLRAQQQSDRLAAQLVICQLPRVDQRILALMWLLAESWGRVTPAGTRLPLSLTHDLIGALIGARRPTVTLALRELTDQAAIVRQDRGWLLLTGPPQATRPPEPLASPMLVEENGSGWSPTPDRTDDSPHSQAELEASFRELTQTVSMLRERHRENAEGFAERLSRLASSRQRCAETRERLARRRLGRRRAPSS